jgi:hypothetical protein
MAYIPNLQQPPPHVNRFKSWKWGTQTHSVVYLLIKGIHIRTINTKSLYLNCLWISETGPSINKEHICEVSNLGDRPLTPVQIFSHKYIEQNYGKYDRTSLHFHSMESTNDVYPENFQLMTQWPVTSTSLPWIYCYYSHMELTFFPCPFIAYDKISAVHETLFSYYQVINQLIF